VTLEHEDTGIFQNVGNIYPKTQRHTQENLIPQHRLCIKPITLPVNNFHLYVKSVSI